jgi:hypothetical protein
VQQGQCLLLLPLFVDEQHVTAECWQRLPFILCVMLRSQHQNFLDCLQDTWRCVTLDDRIPVDLFGRALLVGSRPLQLWPLLLCKAILKVMAVYKTLDMTLPHQVRTCVL